MKASGRILTLLLAFIFAIPEKFPEKVESLEIVPSAWAAPKSKEECEQNPGWVWDSDPTHQRCVRSKQAIEIGAKVRACDELEGVDRQNCLLQNAQDAANDPESGVDDQNHNTQMANGAAAGIFDYSTPAQIVTVLTSYYLLLDSTDGQDCQMTSMYIMLAAGIASILGEVTANIYYRNRLRDIVKSYRDDTTTGAENHGDENTEEYNAGDAAAIDNAQKAAFDYLIDQEEARKTSAMIRSVAYGLGGGLYTASAIAAAVEASSASTGVTTAYTTCQFRANDEAANSAFNQSYVFAGIAGIAGAGGAIGIEAGVGSASSDNKYDGSENADSRQQDRDDDTYYSPIDKKNEIEQINNPDFIQQQNMSLPKDYFVQYNLQHPLDSMLDPIMDDATKDLREISYFPGSYQSATEIERFEMMKRFVHHFVPEAFAADDNGKNLDKSGEILNEDGTVKRDIGLGVDILLEVVMLICRLFMYAGLATLISTAAGQGKALEAMFHTPIGRIAFAGVLAAYSFVIMGLNIAEVINADQRIGAIEEVRDSFIAGGGSAVDSCPNRDDPADPMCYCFNQNGRNEERAHSAICLSVWGEGGIPPATVWRKMANSAGNAGSRCVTSDMKVHMGGRCPCRRKNPKSNKKSKGECAGVEFGGNFPNTGAIRMLGGIASDANTDLAGGLDSSGIETAGDKINNAIKALKNMEKDKKFGPLLAKANAGGAKFKKSIEASLRKSLGANGVGSPMGAPTASALSNIKSPADLKKMVDDNIKKSNLEFNKGAAPVAGAPKDDFNFDFGGENNQGISEDEFANAMDKEYKFDDINNNAGASIFKILSIRYQKTGLKKLFEDKPSDTTK